MIRLKTADDIKGIHDACRIVSETLSLLHRIIEPGMTTKDLDSEAHYFIVSQKARPSFLNYRGFTGSICISVNDEVIHGIPGPRKLLKGDIVSLDCGVEYKGYYGDSAFTTILGNPAPDQENLLKATQEGLVAGIEAFGKSKRTGGVSRAIHKAILPFGYGVVHSFTGHGVGFGVHEDPPVPNISNLGPGVRIKDGLVIAIEPMVCQGSGNVYVADDQWTVLSSDGSLSAHFEHTVAFSKGEVHVLTELPVAM